MSETNQRNVTPSSSTGTPSKSQSSLDTFLERLSDGTQRVTKVIIGSKRKPPRLLKTLLHGSLLGHPLHPVITDIPIGAWTIAALLDIIWLISPTSNAWAAQGAMVSVIVGILSALLAMATGFADWSDTYGSERRVGLYHVLLNTSGLIIYVISFFLRLPEPFSGSISGAILGFIALGLVLFAAYFGGEMVFVKGTGVNHTAWEHGGKNYEAVMALADMEENKLYRVKAANVPVVLLRQGEQVYAIASTCTHAGGPLNRGKLTGDVVECPWHGSRFSMRDGRVLTGPATVKAPRYTTRVREGQVEVLRMGS